MRKLNLGSPLRVALISPAKAAPGLARTHGTGRQAKKHGAITRRPPVAALVNPQLPACHTRLAVRLLFKAGPASTKFVPTPNQREIPTPLALAEQTASKLAAGGTVFNSRPMAHRSSAAEVAWTDTLFGVMQALRWRPIAHGPPLGPLHKVPGIGRPSGRV